MKGKNGQREVNQNKKSKKLIQQRILLLNVPMKKTEISMNGITFKWVYFIRYNKWLLNIEFSKLIWNDRNDKITYMAPILKSFVATML